MAEEDQGAVLLECKYATSNTTFIVGEIRNLICFLLWTPKSAK